MKLRVVSEVPAGSWTTLRLVCKDQRAKLVPPPTDGEFSGEPGALLNDRAASTLYGGLGERGKLCLLYTSDAADE